MSTCVCEGNRLKPRSERHIIITGASESLPLKAVVDFLQLRVERSSNGSSTSESFTA